MKTFPTLELATAVALALTISGFAFNHSDRVEPPHHPDASHVVAHLSNVYATVAPFDRDADGSLDDDEVNDFVAALAAGKIQTPGRCPPPSGDLPDVDRVLTRIAHMYAVVAEFDADADGELDDDEQAALAFAIADGWLRRPGPPHGRAPQR